MNKHFIKASEEYTTLDNHVPAPLLRRSFTLVEKPVKAELSISGLGFYILYVNGVNVTKGHLAPYISNPDDVCYFDTYDVTEQLSEGENVIGIILGNGFINSPGGVVWDFEKAEYRGAPRVALELNCKLSDGGMTLTADGEFLTHPSPILFDDIRLGETYDARLELDGWMLRGFDTRGWKPALKAETPRGVLKKCEAEPILTYREIKPVSITREGDAFLYDFGINSAGICRLTVNGREGQKITMWHGEMLSEGRFYNKNIRFIRPDATFYDDYNQTDRYICSGKGTEVYEPHFVYHGFRYVLVEGIDESQATPELLTYRIMSSAVKTIGGFRCSSERVNKLFAMVKNSDLSNFFYLQTDCPHREKNGWTGDASLSADHVGLILDTEASWREWLYGIRLAQNEVGALPGIVPTSGWGFAWGNGPTWDSILFNLPYILYKYRGCTDVIRENAHAMVRYLEYILTRRSADGTVAIGLGDWVPVNKSANDYAPPLALTDSVMVMDMARKAAEMLDAIGYTHQAAFARGIYEDMRATVRRELVDLDNMLVAGDCESSQAIALYYGVFDKNEKAAAFAHLLRQISEAGGSFDCGFIGMHCIFHVLSDFGENELAYNMIMKDEFPSYAWLIDKGYTSMPEHFLDSEPYPESQNHHFLGDIARWFITRLAGLNVIDSTTVEITPCPVKDIDFASAYYDIPSGRVSVRWSRDESGKISIDYEAPVGVTIKDGYNHTDKVNFD